MGTRSILPVVQGEDQVAVGSQYGVWRWAEDFWAAFGG